MQIALGTRVSLKKCPFVIKSGQMRASHKKLGPGNGGSTANPGLSVGDLWLLVVGHVALGLKLTVSRMRTLLVISYAGCKFRIIGNEKHFT